jgi:hypothetical protein
MPDISAPVGVNAGPGGNQPADVATIHRLLIQVPEADGGPQPATSRAFSGGYGIHTEVAIKKFQWRQFHLRTRPPDGRVDPSGQTLARLNQFEPSRSAPPYAPQRPQPPDPTAARGESDRGLPVLFTQMWNLINQRIAAFPWTELHRAVGYNAARAAGAQGIARPELFIAIFWEETSFRNIRGGNPDMWGFGQVNHTNIGAESNPDPRSFRGRYDRIFTESWLVDDWAHYRGRAHFDRSVDLAILNLVEAYRGTAGRMPRTLHCYALGGTGLTSDHPAVPHWIQCRDSLAALSLSPHLTSVNDSQGVAIRAALWQARTGDPAHGLNPDLAFPPPP